MNSPTEPGSPSPSTPSSGSPPPDELEQIQASNRGPSILGKFTNSFTGGASSSASPSKRRLPGGSSFGAASNTRDAKTRRREDGMGTGGSGRDRDRRSGGDREGWDGKGRKDKDELVDGSLVEILRRDFGDPFLEGQIKHAS
ncbi:hypothetical protein PILCRDRAFT_813459 [Piloderma croceum F 1598]|uniref:Uncharacterized protein n=1 Tax=Piloderma croceum (strain F 1598) TaxID=765440 RepID=A0A0C3CIC4_PILCF|nr:hypothetical protein PILCRDRAFT_813459 [Piloderma croceum F 1598]